MDQLQKLVDSSPDLRSEKSEYLKLAVREGKAVKGTGPHKVKLVGCENALNKDYQTQEEVKGVNLLLEEDGEPRKYFVPTLGKDRKFHYLIERFAGIKEGTELTMEYQRKEGSVRGFINIELAEEEGLDTQTGDDIPIVEEEDIIG